MENFQALRFSHCNNLHIRGLKHKNSQRNHVSINECNNANISNLHMTAPATSPNTDGIDISSSTYLHIQDCIMETGTLYLLPLFLALNFHILLITYHRIVVLKATTASPSMVVLQKSIFPG